MSAHKNSETIEYPDGRVELRHDTFEEISASPLFNRDLAPVKVSERNWTTYNYAALWISMAHCIPTYMLSSGLISAGMNWWQALITIFCLTPTPARSTEFPSRFSRAQAMALTDRIFQR